MSGEVKGKLLNEDQISSVVTLLARYHIILEVSVIDLGIHTLEGVTAYKNNVRSIDGRAAASNSMRRLRSRFAGRSIKLGRLPFHFFLQAMTSFDVLHTVIRHVPLFFAQRQPRELGRFAWIVDGKDPTKVTEWETWWPWHAHGVLANRSRNQPGPELVGADSTLFTLHASTPEDRPKVIDLQLLLADLRFSSGIEPGLELIDILVNAVRRALIGNLRFEGWRDIRRLIIHRRDHYINLMLLAGVGQPPQTPDLCGRR